MTANRASTSQGAQARVVTAIQQLAVADGELADVLASLTAVVAEEAVQNAGFGARLHQLLVIDRGQEYAGTPRGASPTAEPPTLGGTSAKARPKRARREPGPWDPFSVYADVGEAGLRAQLSGLELEQLRDMIAEHGMNSDGLAMRWTKSDRVVGRIVDRVVDRAAKGDAFRRT